MDIIIDIYINYPIYLSISKKINAPNIYMNTLKCILTNYTSFLFHANLLIHFNDLQCFEAFVRIPENSETNGNNDKNNVIIIVQYLILSKALFLSSQFFSSFALVFTFIRPVYNTIFDSSFTMLSQH